MAKYTDKDVADLATAIRRGADGVAMLTGAGCSISAGIPLATTLVKEIHERFAAEVEKLVPAGQRDDYGLCMGALAVDERKALLDPYLRAARINWAHIAIASLMCNGLVRRVLTFNFDSVMARACGLLGLYPATYDFGLSPSDQPDYLVQPSIVHLHGQGYGPIMLNSQEETATHAERLRAVLADTVRTWPLIVVGYSGAADKVFPILRSVYSGRWRLYWLGYQEEPSADLKPFFEAHRATAQYIGGADSDAFLIALAQTLGCFPPTILSDPAAHLLSEIDGVQPFPLDKTKAAADPLADARERLEENRHRLKMSRAAQAVLQGTAEEQLKKARQGAGSLVNAIKAMAQTPVMRSMLLGGGAQRLLHEGLAEHSPAKLRAAVAEFRAAADLSPGSGMELAEIAHALALLGAQTRDNEPFEEAEFLFQRAAASDGGNPYLRPLRSHALMLGWEVTRDAGLLDRARSLMDEQEERFGTDYVNEARMAAAHGDEDNCREWAWAARDLGKLRPVDLLSQSLIRYRDSPWRQELLASLQPAEDTDEA